MDDSAVAVVIGVLYSIRVMHFSVLDAAMT